MNSSSVPLMLFFALLLSDLISSTVLSSLILNVPFDFPPISSGANELKLVIKLGPLSSDTNAAAFDNTFTSVCNIYSVNKYIIFLNYTSF